MKNLVRNAFMIQMQKELKWKNTHILLDLPMKVNGLMDSEMDMVSINGQMELFMKGSGVSDKHVVKANSHMLMETCTKAIGITIKLMDKEFIATKMELSIRANGFMTFSMVRVMNHGQMDQHLMEIMKKERNMG